MNTKPIPEGYHTITPQLCCRGAAEAIELYKEAFGAEEIMRMPMPDGKLMHAEIRIGDSPIMLSDEFPEMGANSPETVGGTAGSLHISHADVDRAHERAVKAGMVSELPPTNMFWGDRYCKLKDRFGHSWSIATQIEALTPEEMMRRAEKEMSNSSDS